MATRSNDERTVQQSFLDRIIEEDQPRTWVASANRLREHVLRDLDWLLNTRRTPIEVPEALGELDQSLFRYGLPDISSLSATSPETPRVLARSIKEAVELFEPRLSGVRVSVSASDKTGKKEIRFKVKATLEMEPNPERVVFDTVLEISSGTFTVGGG